VKTSMDAGYSIKSTEGDKNIPSHFTFLRKIHVCVFAAVILWQLEKEKQKTRSPLPFSFFDAAFALSRRLKKPITQCLQKVSPGSLGGN